MTPSAVLAPSGLITDDSTPPDPTASLHRTAMPALRRLPVPETEPAAAQRIDLRPPERVADGQGRLTLTLPSAGELRPRTLVIDASGPRPSVRPVRGWAQDSEDLDQPDDDRSTAPVAAPDPQAWVATFVQAAVEVAAAARPASQLVRWTSLDVQSMLVRRAAMSSRFDRATPSRRRAVVRTVMVCLPAPDVCEASAVVNDRDRVRAVALRAEAFEGRWRVTALQIG